MNILKMIAYTNVSKSLLLISLLSLFISATVPVENNYTLSKIYTVTIDGTSNIHNWSEQVEKVTGDGIIDWNSDGSFDLKMIHIKMDVHSIKSDMGSVMNNNTYKALKADANPEIIYTLKVPIESIQANSSEKTMLAKGSITIAGVTRFNEIHVKMMMSKSGNLSFEGTHTLKMTDYGIAPPTALFGTLKTGNEITIHFKTSLIVSPH